MANVTCERCGTIFDVPPSRLVRRRFCSTACKHPNEADRFESFTEMIRGCLVWKGHRNAAGYGTFKVGRASELAHRVAWRMAHGPIADGVDILHRCDNPPCVLEAHLFAGDAAANMADMRAKGRGAHPDVSHRQRDRLGRFVH